MCDVCEKLEGKALMDKDVYYSLLHGNMSQGYITKASTDEPSFEVDEEMGEGEASQDELSYRTELLVLLAALFPVITRIVQSNDSIDTKITKIDKELANFQSKASKLAEKSNSAAFKNAVAEANQTLNSLFEDIEKIKADNARLNIIIQQQLYNIEDISNFLRGRIIQGLYINEVDSVYGQATLDETFLNTAFNEAQSRLDKMGMFGYLKSFDQGNLTTLLAGAALMGAILEADWVPDYSNPDPEWPCDDCIGLEENGPYLLTEWPEQPHFGCRCDRENIRIVGT